MNKNYLCSTPVWVCADLPNARAKRCDQKAATVTEKTKREYTGSDVLASTKRVVKGNYKWVLWVLLALALGALAAFLLWLWWDNRKKRLANAARNAMGSTTGGMANSGSATGGTMMTGGGTMGTNTQSCTSSDQCSSLCDGARFPCVASCDKGNCQTHALGCVGAYSSWCPALGRCIDTLTEACPSSSPMSSAPPGASAQMMGAMGTMGAAIVAPEGMSSYSMKNTADSVQRIIAEGAPWQPTAAGERASEVAGRPVKLDSAGNLSCMDSRGHWWRKGTGAAWWWKDPSTMAVVKKMDGVPRMWKQEASGMHLARPLGTLDSQWMPCPKECSMDMDADVAQANAVTKGVMGMMTANTSGLWPGNGVNPAEYVDTGCSSGWGMSSYPSVPDNMPRFMPQAGSAY